MTSRSPESEDLEESQKRFSEHLASKTGMPAKAIEKGVEDLITRSQRALGTDTRTEEKLKPPYGNTVWYGRFFELIRSKSWDTISIEVIQANIIGGPNATILFKALRFLDLVKENGKTTPKLEGLRLRGEEFKQNLKKVVLEAYADFLKTVAIEQAKPENVVNYFMKTYGFGETTAQQALKIFVYLAQEASIPLSEELTLAKAEAPRQPKPRVEKSRKETETPSTPLKAPPGIHLLKDGDITVWLPEGDRKAALKAKDLIDYYIKHLEE